MEARLSARQDSSVEVIVLSQETFGNFCLWVHSTSTFTNVGWRYYAQKKQHKSTIQKHYCLLWDFWLICSAFSLSLNKSLLSVLICLLPAQMPIFWVRWLSNAPCPVTNYLSSRWPRNWSDIIFMRNKIHFAELSKDQVTPVHIFPHDNYPSFKFNLIWIVQRQALFHGIGPLLNVSFD